MQCSMKWITIWNGHAQPMFTVSDFGWPRVLSFSECLVLELYLLIPLYNVFHLVQPISSSSSCIMQTNDCL